MNNDKNKQVTLNQLGIAHSKLAIGVVAGIIISMCLLTAVALVNASNGKYLVTGPVDYDLDGYKSAINLMTVAFFKFLAFVGLIALPIVLVWQKSRSWNSRFITWLQCLLLLVGPALLFSVFALGTAVNWQLNTVVDFKVSINNSSPVSVKIPLLLGSFTGVISCLFSAIILRRLWAIRPPKNGFRNSFNVHSK